MIYEKPRAELFAQDAPESEIKPFTAWLRGLGIAFDETGGLPEMESFNGLLQALNGYIKYLEQNGFAEWSSDLEYPVGAGVRVGAVWYRAKTQNIKKPPSASQNDWSLFLNASDLSFGDPIQLINGTVSIKDASQTQKGSVQFANNTEISNKANISKTVNPANVATIAQSTDLGLSQTWKSVSRGTGVTYGNNTAKPIMLSASIYLTDLQSASITVGGVQIASFYVDATSGSAFIRQAYSFIVPPFTNYYFSGSGLQFVAELS